MKHLMIIAFVALTGCASADYAGYASTEDANQSARVSGANSHFPNPDRAKGYSKGD